MAAALMGSQKVAIHLKDCRMVSSTPIFALLAALSADNLRTRWLARRQAPQA